MLLGVSPEFRLGRRQQQGRGIPAKKAVGDKEGRRHSSRTYTNAAGSVGAAANAGNGRLRTCIPLETEDNRMKHPKVNITKATPNYGKMGTHPSHKTLKKARQAFTGKLTCSTSRVQTSSNQGVHPQNNQDKQPNLFLNRSASCGLGFVKAHGKPPRFLLRPRSILVYPSGPEWR